MSNCLCGKPIVAKDVSAELQEKQSVPCWAVRTTLKTMTINIDGLHNIFVLHKVMLSRPTQEKQFAGTKKSQCMGRLHDSKSKKALEYIVPCAEY